MGFCLYSIRNLVNGKQYIGQTTKTRPVRRWYEHRVSSRTRDEPLYRAMRKYGVGSFVFEPHMLFKSQAELDAAEVQLIKECNSRSHADGYNVAPGGCVKGPSAHSEQTKAKIAATRRGRKASAETRAKMSASRVGKRASPETRVRMSAAHTPEIRQRRAAAQRGRKASPETRAKMSEARSAWWRKRRS